MFSFKTILEFNDYFKDEATCYNFYEMQRWGGVPVCPHCGGVKFYKVKPRGKFKDIPSYRCAHRPCDLPFTVRTNSIFEGSQIELRKWFHAIYELTTSKKGISSVELATRIGVSQKTAWLMNHKIREMLGVSTSNDGPMGEGGQIVEVDETYVGGKVANMKKSKRRKIRDGEIGKNENKNTVMGYLERGGKLKLVALDKRRDVQDSLVKTVSKEAVLITDTAPYYSVVGKEFASHETVNHSMDEFVRDRVIHTNGVEGAFSILDRAIIGVFHFVSSKHLQRYCDEISLKYNGRSMGNADRFNQVIQNSNVKKITYRKLTK